MVTIIVIISRTCYLNWAHAIYNKCGSKLCSSSYILYYARVIPLMIGRYCVYHQDTRPGAQGGGYDVLGEARVHYVTTECPRDI